MNCQFFRKETCQLAHYGGKPRESDCSACKQSGQDNIAASRFYKGLKPSTECVFRGEEIRRVPCQSCKGSVMALVFSCQIHGECTLFSKPVDGVKSCSGCPDKK